MVNGKYLRAWLAGLIACILLIPVCFRWFDLPVARIFPQNIARASVFGLPSAVILAGELLVATILALVRMVRGRLPKIGKVLMIAILASFTAFTANNYVLKLVFGVPPPFAVLFQGAHHGLHFLGGGPDSSFPSGHMSLAGAFAGVWIRLYPRATPAFALLLALGMALLVAGDWHFLSDVIAGTFVGVTVGLMAGALWLEHDARRHG